MTVRLALSNGLHMVVDAYVVGDWAVHLPESADDPSYRITHVPSGLRMPERAIGYLNLHEAVHVAQRFATDCADYPPVPTFESGAEYRHIFEAIVAEVTA